MGETTNEPCGPVSGAQRSGILGGLDASGTLPHATQALVSSIGEGMSDKMPMALKTGLWFGPHHTVAVQPGANHSDFRFPICKMRVRKAVQSAIMTIRIRFY